MKKLACWIIVSAAGLALMSLSHFYCQRMPGAKDASQEGIIYVGKGEPNSQPGEFEFTKGTVLLSGLSARGQQYRQMARAMGQRIERAYCVYFAEKVFFDPDISTDAASAVLERGRLPRAGANEVVAGYHAREKEKLNINGQQLQVVGVLKPEVHLFCESYLLYDQTLASELIHSDDESVRDAYILRLPQDSAQDPQTRRQLAKVFPGSEFVPYVPLLRVEPRAFYLYMLGMSLLLIGGALALVNIFRLLAGRVRYKWLSLPLGEVTKYRRLFLAVHLSYFALVVLFALLAYMVPEIQFCLLANVKAQVTGGSGPLAVAGRAYMSKNILRAAVTTFAINFPLGSLVCITVPSMIVPGAGALVAAVRAMLWGFLLSPGFAALSKVMVAHSVTLLLEGEGYVLATFFALLVPVYLFRKAEGPTTTGEVLPVSSSSVPQG
ncbi:MAG TPA: hypothetical protein VMX13_17980 [Sedimentisphaerales bacterium]|nr:hypothetical protein [Sedimentisphaerales bacterium]